MTRERPKLMAVGIGRAAHEKPSGGPLALSFSPWKKDGVRGAPLFITQPSGLAISGGCPGAR